MTTEKIKLSHACKDIRIGFLYQSEASGPQRKEIKGRYFYTKHGQLYVSATDISVAKVRYYLIEWMVDVHDAETGEALGDGVDWFMSFGYFDPLQACIQPKRWYKVCLLSTTLAFLARQNGELGEHAKELIAQAVRARMTSGSRGHDTEDEIKECVRCALFIEPTMGDVKDEILRWRDGYSKSQWLILLELIDKLDLNDRQQSAANEITQQIRRISGI